MRVQKTHYRKYARRFCSVAIIMLYGCGVFSIPADSNGQLSSLNLVALGIDPSNVRFESNTNNIFESADTVSFDDNERVLAIQGQISSSDDIDVYDLGPVQRGDRIVVDVTSADSLRGAIALFDENQSSLLVNDHRNVYLGRRDPFVDVVIRRSSESCYVSFSSTPGYDTSGDYALVTSREPSADLPDARPSTILLDFDGDLNVRIGSRPAINVPRFNAASISSLYQDMTELMVDRIVETIRQDFEGFDVDILSTSEGAIYDEIHMTRIFFGTYDQALLGVAEGVDEFNADESQVAIVFTETFSAFMRANPTTGQMAQAIGNVASHEIGHLLGLIHTDDPNGIMDVTASIRRLLEDQSFKQSPIYSAVFPIGFQDSSQSLLDTLGGDEAVLFAKEQPWLNRPLEIHDDDLPARSEMFLSTCGLEE